MKYEEMTHYKISREEDGIQLLKDKPEIIDWLWKSKIYRFYETGSPENKYVGADFVLENGKLIDLKCQLGEYKPGKYYDKIVISVYRYNNYENTWKEVLLDKKTDYWLFTVQVSSNIIQFYVISRKQAEKLKNKLSLSEPRMCGGSQQKYIIIDLNDPDIHKAKFQLNLEKDIFEKSI